MCIPESNGKPCAAFSIMACAVLFSATLVQAQTFSDLQNLAFYPAPLDTLDTEPVAPTACSCPDMIGSYGMGSIDMESIDMAVLEKSAMSSYLQDIAEIEDNAGSYAPELTQQQTNAGLLYQQQNRHEQAVSSLERAAASSRIHNGLYSSEQIVLAEHTIDSLVALGRFAEAEDKYNQLLIINQKFYGPEAAQTAHALLGLGQLQVERLQHDLAQPGFEALYQAQAHFVDAIRILIDNEAWTDPAILALERNLVLTYYLDALRAGVINNPLSYAIGDESSHSRMRSRADRRSLPEQYLKGKQAYLRMIGYLKKDPDADIAAIADVMQGLADWNLLFGKQQEAEKQYRQLEQLMAMAGTAPAEAAAILHPAVPVTLPALVDSALSPSAISETSLSRGYVDVSFNVNRHGRATNLEVLGTSDGTGSAVVDHLGKLVRNAQFRPAADAGADFSLRYYFSY